MTNRSQQPGKLTVYHLRGKRAMCVQVINHLFTSAGKTTDTIKGAKDSDLFCKCDLFVLLYCVS